jgi:hypothetical protein
MLKTVVNWADLFVPPELHWTILRDFVRSQLQAQEVGLLASGVDIEDVISIVNRIGFGLDDSLNNPFTKNNIVPFENHLGQKHWAYFLALLKTNKHLFTDMLIEAPYDFNYKQANDEHVVLCKKVEEIVKKTF